MKKNLNQRFKKSDYLKMDFLKLKIQILAFVILTSCSWKGENRHIRSFLLKPLSLFVDSSACDKAYKTTSQAKSLSKSEMENIMKQAENCLEENEITKALFVFERLLKESKRQNAGTMEIKKWEEKLAGLFFYKIKNYEKALKYYTELLKKPLSLEERFSVQYHIAESFFHLKKYSQALRELEKCSFKEMSLKQEQTANFLKGRIFIAKEQFEQALLFFEEQIEKFPKQESFFREYLALIYELKKDFVSAAKELEKIDPQSVFIKQKIKRLSERQSKQPGAVRP